MKSLLLLALSSLTLNFAAAMQPLPREYAAHEWGTFTSVQGADGVQMKWNSFTAGELPEFVYRGPLSKDLFQATQRLETPVIYFHTRAPLFVDVSVRFPRGQVTEWFPAATVPIVPIVPPSSSAQPAIQWKGVRVLPSLPAGSSLPVEPKGNHYYAAREADARFVQVTTNGKVEWEKFLFYRGAGNFTAPLTVTLPAPGETHLQLANTGAQPLRDLFVVKVGDDGMAITHAAQLAPKSSFSVPVPKEPSPLASGRVNLATQMQSALKGAGLTGSEAAAMVKTWDESWFAEKGLRVLYVLPRSWADDVLPLKLTPEPTTLERVFVGRAEVITPAMEQALAAEIARFSTDPTTAIGNTRALAPDRFRMATLSRLLQKNGDKAFSETAWKLLNTARQPATETRLGAR